MKVLVFAPGALEGTVAEIDDAKVLTSLQELVGGCVDYIKVAPGIDVWVHDEGLLLGLPGWRVVGNQCVCAARWCLLLQRQVILSV